ncbi:NAD-dependent epimerase/dehydratase family protein [Methylacidiphilum caldifontis]|uniref:NAD-dependent epimerase/dehydratase family protein n=1 Tax=Methylacidiphilum caldifontis TaxID=2795386 RepID=UPI001A90758A|nr:NAD-dependent epimerase/dehydratase family protein [Methylacidiphilum caldifontis]QSR87886.1 NAD-dependent epimerase/dehydratase family protein [Methylacidiphilum caldifontis]
MKKAVVAGAGGFIGHHLASYLKTKGYWVRGVDIKEPEFEKTSCDEFLLFDLRYWENCLQVTKEVDEVYQLAADMGGIGYISGNHAEIAKNNILINTHMLEASYKNGVKRYFYSSSACIYPAYRQQSADVLPLKEEDAIPAEPEEGYGWEKLFTEKLCQYYQEEKRVETRVARFHNVYGPLGTYEGGREKAPAAICRKVALAQENSEIEVWGDGKQTRSFLYIDDCVEGIYLITQSNYDKPLNLGSEELVTIDQLVEMVAKVAGKKIRIKHDLSKPQGVRGRNSDNSKLYQIIGWKPKYTLMEGLQRTYPWIATRLSQRT